MRRSWTASVFCWADFWYEFSILEPMASNLLPISAFVRALVLFRFPFADQTLHRFFFEIVQPFQVVLVEKEFQSVVVRLLHAFGTSATPFDDEIEVREDDEWRRQSRLLFVLHDDTEPVEFPDLVRKDVRPQENGIENGDE